MYWYQGYLSQSQHSVSWLYVLKELHHTRPPLHLPALEILLELEEDSQGL